MAKEFLFVNFLRAIAAFWVLAAHCMIWGGWYGIPLPAAKIAVDLFMMISGFLMAANAHARWAFEPMDTARNWFRFLCRRFFRIAPAYYFSLAIAAFLGNSFLFGYQHLQTLNPARWVSGGVYDPARIEYSASNILLHLTFIFGLHPRYSFSTFLPDWSLSLEMQFYFVFPALLLLMKRFGYAASAIFIGCGSFLVGLFISGYVFYFEPSLLVMKLNYFIAGMLVFRFVLNKEAGFSHKLIASVILLLVCLDYKYGWELLILPLLAANMMMLGWLEANDKLPKLVHSFFQSRLVIFASNASYGVYLFHGFFISAAGFVMSRYPGMDAFPAPYRVGVIFLFVVCFSYLTAWFIFNSIEIPGIRFGSNLLKRCLPPVVLADGLKRTIASKSNA